MKGFDEFLDTYCVRLSNPSWYLYQDRIYHEDELVAIYEMLDVDEGDQIESILWDS